MNNKELLTELIGVADALDAQNFTREANVITEIAVKVAQMSEDYEDEGRAGFYDNHEDQFHDQEQAQQMMQAEGGMGMSMDEAYATVQKLMPMHGQLPPHEAAMLDEAMRVLDQSSPSHQMETSDFARKLHEGGADVI